MHNVFLEQKFAVSQDSWIFRISGTANKIRVCFTTLSIWRFLIILNHPPWLFRGFSGKETTHPPYSVFGVNHVGNKVVWQKDGTLDQRPVLQRFSDFLLQAALFWSAPCTGTRLKQLRKHGNLKMGLLDAQNACSHNHQMRKKVILEKGMFFSCR